MPIVLPQLKISQRLALSYGAVILLLIAMTFIGIGKLHTLSLTTDDALKDKYPKTILVNKVIADLGIIARDMRNALILTDSEQVREQLTDIVNASDKMNGVLTELKERITDDKGRELVKQIDIVNSAYIVNQADFISLVDAHKMGEAKNLLLVDLYGYQDTYFELLDRLNREQGELMDQASREVGQTYQNARNVMYALVIIAALLSVAITYLISHSLLQQLGGEPDYAAEIARQIAAGNLSSDIAIAESDHTSLLYAMGGMRDSLVQRGNALQDTNRELAQTVGKLAETIDSLNRARDELVSSEKLAALGSLVAGISHELNTPIGNSIMAASTLTDVTREFTKATATGVSRSGLNLFVKTVGEAGEILIRNLNRAGDLVTSFKQVAVDRESSQGRRFFLSETVGEIIMMLQPRIKKTPFVIRQDIPDNIEMASYPGPLGQVVINLVNNALLHGFDRRTCGTVTISARPLGDAEVELSVQDDGNGIAPENLKRIYDPFFTTKLGAGGSGLGLHITYNIVSSLLRGRIKVASEVGVGTTFTLVMPLNVLSDASDPGVITHEMS
jgi:two-component system NtrC family sensor kinase